MIQTLIEKLQAAGATVGTTSKLIKNKIRKIKVAQSYDFHVIKN